MKQNMSQMALILISCIIIIAGCKAPITIQQSHIQPFFTPGSTSLLYWDSTSQLVNVGKTGGPNVYDFSKLPFVKYDSSEILSVSQIPQLASRYSHKSVTAREEGGTVYPVFSFSNNTFYREGRGRFLTDTTEWYQHFIPAAEFLRFPVAYHDRYNNTITAFDTTYVNGIPSKTSKNTNSSTEYVDGYGTLLLPGGLSYKCLRIQGKSSSPETSKGYQFWTREGAVILIESDLSQPDTGMITRHYVIYFSPQPRK